MLRYGPPSLVLLAILIGCAAELESPEDFRNPGGGGGMSPGGAGGVSGGGVSGGGVSGGGVSGGGASGAGMSGVSGGGGGNAVCDAPGMFFTVEGDQGGCAGDACHNPGVIVPDLITADPGTRLLNVTGTFCPSGKYIDPVTPANSLLITKVLASNTCLQRMPAALPPLDDAEIQCLTEWVTAAAGQ